MAAGDVPEAQRRFTPPDLAVAYPRRYGRSPSETLRARRVPHERAPGSDPFKPVVTASVTMQDVAAHAVVMTDTHGAITEWNSGAEVLLGRRGDDVLGEPVDVIVPPPLPDAHWAPSTARWRHRRSALRLTGRHRSCTPPP